jgi:hypothetical protein
MKSLLVALLAVVAAGEGRGGPAERAVLAAMKLSEQPNYSWTSLIVDDARTYRVEGKTRRGTTWLHMPMVVSVARRLGPRAANELEAFFRGNERCVIHTGEGWQALDELPRENLFWSDEDEWRFTRPNESARWTFAGGPDTPADSADPFVRLLRAAGPVLNDGENDVPRSNAQFGVSHPHEELGVIVSCSTALKANGDVAAGTLSDLGAQLLLVHDGQTTINPLGATGQFRLEIKNGIVTRYALKLEGLLEIDGHRVHVHQYSQTTVGEIGSTQFEVPDEAKRKLGLD